MKNYCSFILLTLSVLFFSCRNTYKINVEAGGFDRLYSTAKFKLPESLNGNEYHLVDENEKTVPLQIDIDRNAWFIVDSLSAGEEKNYSIVPGNIENNEVIYEKENGAVSFQINNRELIKYHFQETPLPRENIDPVYKRGGYIHPVNTPRGKSVTDDYPPNHVHHHGIWAAWTKTEFQGRTPDFWNMAAKTGTVNPVSLDTVWSGPVIAGLQATHEYVDLSAEEPVTALKENWKIVVHNIEEKSSPIVLFDLEVSQTCAQDDPLILPEYRYGGVGFRGNWQWNGPDSTFFLTSAGMDRSNGHATRADWCHIGGYIDDELAGITMMCHPDNFRAPQPMRIHPTEPFFNYAPSQAGDWSIKPGDNYVAKYRFVVYDGPFNNELIYQVWNDYSKPVKVEIYR